MICSKVFAFFSRLSVEASFYRRDHSESSPYYKGPQGLRRNSLNRNIQRDPSTDIRTFNGAFSEDSFNRYSRFQDPPQSQSLSFLPNGNYFLIFLKFLKFLQFLQFLISRQGTITTPEKQVH